MGSLVLKAKSGQPVDIEELPAVEKSTLAVEPGEVVFVLTQEKLNLPRNMMAVLSSKRKLAHGGIIILGGSVVDPLYHNYLQIGLYNFSSTPFPLRPGKKLIAATFYELTGNELAEFEVPECTRAEGFCDELQKTKRQLQELPTSITDDKQWQDDFKTALDSHNNQLDKIIEGLEKEIKAREKGDTEVLNKLDQVSSVWSSFKASFNLVGWIIAAIIGAAISQAVSHFIK